MNEVAKITEEGYTLTHSWHLDNFGLKRNSFDVFCEATRTHYPFWGMIRVSNQEKGTAFAGDDTSSYTENEYKEMLKEQVEKISKLSN